VKVIVCENAAAVGRVSADLVAADIKAKEGKYVLGLATGSTPLPLYGELIARHRAGELCFANVTSFNLDEYYPIAPNHDQSYYYFMWLNLFAHINICLRRTNVLNGLATDPKAECKAYEKRIKAEGGIDLQVLGIGGNGHIAFNEPGSGPKSRTRVVKLDEKTRKDNSRFFNNKIEDVPTHALSMGIGTIFEARKNILLATGEYKGEAIISSVLEPPTPKVPASLLQDHPDVAFLIDTDCAKAFLAKTNDGKKLPKGVTLEIVQ